MARLMSVAFTEDAVRARTKTVTRRKNWWQNKHGRQLLKPGDTLTLCRKVMGRRPGEPVVRICDVTVLDVRREPLYLVALDGEVAREGFPGMGPAEFIHRYFTPQGIAPGDDVTRIEWAYIDTSEPAPYPGTCALCSTPIAQGAPRIVTHAHAWEHYPTCPTFGEAA